MIRPVSGLVHEPSERQSPKQLLEQTLRRLPARTRIRLRAQWFLRDVLHAIPGYYPVSFMLYRVRRQGWRGAFEPPFNITKQDRTVFDKRLRWHDWGVLQEGDSYRAYTPTSSSALVSLPTAWQLLENVYWGRARDTTWTPR